MPRKPTGGRPGRPKKPDAMHNRIDVRVSADLYARLEDYGREAGWSPGQVARGFVLLVEMMLADPKRVFTSMAIDPDVRRTQLVALMKDAAEREPELPLGGAA